VAGRAVEGEVPVGDGDAIEIGPFDLSVARSARAADTSNSVPDRTAEVPILTGLGPLDPLFADDSVNEIMINGPEEILVERRGAVSGRISVLGSGGAGTGKTTLLAALCGFIAPRERVVTIEDAAELRLPLAHVLPLESRPPDAAGEGAVAIRDLVRNALRMRP